MDRPVWSSTLGWPYTQIQKKPNTAASGSGLAWHLCYVPWAGRFRFWLPSGGYLYGVGSIPEVSFSISRWVLGWYMTLSYVVRIEFLIIVYWHYSHQDSALWGWRLWITKKSMTMWPSCIVTLADCVSTDLLGVVQSLSWQENWSYPSKYWLTLNSLMRCTKSRTS